MLLKNVEMVPAKLLGESVEESRAKRLEKQKSRYRDRGGYVRVLEAVADDT